MKRREFLMTTGAAAAGLVLLPRLAHAEAGRIDWYTSSDQNVLDFWTNIVKPTFEAANPGVTLNLVDAGDAPGNIAIGERALAALAAQGRPAGRLLRELRPAPARRRHRGRPLRQPEGGRPLQLVEDQPARDRHRLFDALPRQPGAARLRHHQAEARGRAEDLRGRSIAWIKANPGQFIYNRPDKGGSGGNFVRRAIYEVNGKDPAAFTVDNFTAEAAEAALDPGLGDPRRTSRPSLFDEGAYTSGNTQSLQLLGQSAVTMIPAWSDQALQAIDTGVLPETTGLVQLTDLGAARRLLAQRRARQRRQQGRGAEARRLHPHRGDPERRPHRARRLPRRLLGLRLAGAAREVQGRHPRRRSRSSPAATGRSRSTTAGTATSRRTWTAAVTLRAGGRHRRHARRGRWPIGLLLVAPPVFLVGWLVIWPIVSAITRTLWLPLPGRRPALLARDLRLLLLRPLQPRQPRGHALDHRRLRRLPRADLPLDRALPALRAPAASPAYVQGLAIFPMFVPSIILSYAFIRVLGPNGTVDLLLNAVGLPKIRTPYLTPWGPVIGLVWDNIPITVLILLSGLGAVSNQSIEAARDVGAGRWAVLRHIILPRISNSILVARQLHRARHLLRLHAALRPRPRLARDDGPLHAAHLPRPQRPDQRDHPGGHHLRLLHRSSGSSTSARSRRTGRR